MKIIYLIACFAIISSCTFTKQQKAEKAIKYYLKTHLKDPNSYENVSFGPILELKDTTYMFDGKIDTFKNAGGFEILHTYRSKNGFSGTITKSEYFIIYNDFKQVSCCWQTPRPHK